MSEMVKRVWSALDGCLVFDIAINREPEDGGPSLATVRCGPVGQPGLPGEAEEVVAIYPGKATWFNLKFRSGGYVYGHLQQRSHVHVDGVDSIGIAADIRFGFTGRYDETRFEGLMVVCPSHQPQPPEPPPEPPPGPPAPPDEDEDEDPDPGPRIAGELEELFPYVYVRRWPRIAADDLRFGFITWTDASPPGEAFVDHLAAAATLGRYAAEALAVWCIDGQAPYAGVFVPDLAGLSGPIRDMAHVAEGLWRAGPADADWLDRVVEELGALLRRYGETGAYFGGAAYAAALERVWQSYFALVAVLGYDPRLLTEFSLCLWLAHVVSVATTVDAEGELAAADLTPRQRHAVANATVILPASAFPLPSAPAGQASPPAPESQGWIEPFAIGDLQMVRHRLKRYAPGEIARIENVLRGERREIRSRRGRRVVELQQHAADDEQVLQADDGDTRSGLLEETRKTVAERSVTNDYQNFQTSYGPPTQATLNGSWKRTFSGGGAPSTTHDVTRFAREIVNTSVNRISRRVSGVRATSSLTQVEESVCSVFDNTGGEGNVRAVFRWLNKVYEASVVNYGSRLMMELLIRRPATDYIARQSSWGGRAPTAPPALDRLGVRSFQDIGPETYARICAAYQVTDVTPPPLSRAFVTATLRGGEDRLLAIPPGYMAVDAFANCLSAPPGSPPQVIVGRQAVTPGDPSSPLLPYGENVTIPVSVSGTSPGLSPPDDGSDVLVNVEVQCAPTARAMDEWRISVYGALSKAHQDLARRHADHGPTAARSAQANRRIERRELKAACVRLLMERLVSLAGPRSAAASPPSPFEVNQPRYLQFLDEALEWPEMAYSFQAGPDGADDEDDELFAAFLAADQARVLVPVRPDHVMAFLYFFTSGAIWEGPDGLVATVNPAGRDGVGLDEVALVNDLKHAARREGAPTTVGPSWEVVVPTSLQVIDEAPGGEAGGLLERASS